jgi:hypothetical protein
MMARTADVWWDSMAEGMSVREQLQIIFGEGNAQVGFGEMVDIGDGVYLYKDLKNLTYGEYMTDVDCTQIPMKVALTKIQGKTCYVYHQEATPEAPYAVDEYINIKVTDKDVVGTKLGTQKGPDMSNGYTGTMKGTIDNDGMITSVYSYSIEGSKNSEKEIYKVTPDGLDKIRYPLIEVKGMLVPDTTQESKIVTYGKTMCK